MLGQVFGHFRVVERIGAGGMGVVYLAHDQHLDRPVALKVLPTALPAEATPRRRFRQEALALSRLNHPNIAVVHDFDTFGEVDVLVMEYVPGVTLSERLHAGALTEPEVLAIGAQFAAGLEAAHAQGIVHRDLKPSNLRLTPDGHLKILDFGLARLFEGSDTALTQTETDVSRPPGTLAYMAPELLRGLAPMPATDIYAAGITLYELATGSPPFSGSRPHVIDQILNQPPEPPKARSRQISDGLDGTILKAIDKRPDRRYQSARELLVDLERCAEPSSGAPFVSERRVSRRNAVIAGTAALVAGAAWWRFGPAADVSAAFPPRGWAVIADFENRTGDAQLDRIVQESLLLALQQSSYVNVFSRDRLFDALRRMRRPDGERVSERIGLDVCRRENAQVLLAGAIEQSGEAMRVTVRALAPSGDLLFAEVAELGKKDEFFARVDDLARRVRRRLGETPERIQQQSEPLDKVTTRSFDALRLTRRPWIESLVAPSTPRHRCCRLRSRSIRSLRWPTVSWRACCRPSASARGFSNIWSAHSNCEIPLLHGSAISSRPRITPHTNATTMLSRVSRCWPPSIPTTSTPTMNWPTPGRRSARSSVPSSRHVRCSESSHTHRKPASCWCCSWRKTARSRKRWTKRTEPRR